MCMYSDNEIIILSVFKCILCHCHRVYANDRVGVFVDRCDKQLLAFVE